MTEQTSTSNRGEWTELNGTTLYYEVMGQGPPLVLIHAGIADSRMWDNQFNVFAKQYRVVRYDVRGFGKSPNPAGSYSDHQNLYDLLAHLGIEQAAILGVSNGGRIAIDFTLTYPEMVTALMLVAPSVGGAAVSDEIKQGWEREEAALEAGDIAGAVEVCLQMWVDGPRRTPDQIDPTVRERVRLMLTELYQIPEGLDEGEAEPLEPTAISRLADIRPPTLVIVGDRDFNDKLKLADLLATDIPRAKRVVIQGVAHLPNMEKPTEFNQIVLDFLKETSG